MVGYRRRPRIFRKYDFDGDFGVQPRLLEIQLGYGLFPLVDESKGEYLLREISYSRNLIEMEYGIPIPGVRICDNMSLEPYEYSILFNGFETGKNNIRVSFHLCLDTGLVNTPLDCDYWDKVKDPAFGIDGFLVPDDEVDKYIKAGYKCIPPERLIGTHLTVIIKKHRTKILDQNMVSMLVEKVRKNNPDVISDVFFYHQFSMSNMKILLNCLLAEEVSIRDMNTILETIADYIQEDKTPYVLAERVRESLAYSILKKYADKKNKIHLISVSQDLSEYLKEFMHNSNSKLDTPYFLIESELREKLIEKIAERIEGPIKNGIYPVFVVESSIRIAFAKLIHEELPFLGVVSDKELYTVKQELDLENEGELTLDD